MTTISAKIIADSVSPDDFRLTTIHMRYPRFIHSELMTHRMFSRNARSSRAVPVGTMLKEIENDPVIPLHWGANQKGMQADLECNGYVHGYGNREQAWLSARDRAVNAARAFSEAGYHKQVVNRLLEPFMHIDVLVSATEWANFLALRDHHMAEPHIAMLAREVKAALWGSEPELLQPGRWHRPYVTDDDIEKVWVDQFGGNQGNNPDAERQAAEILTKVSVARCARISYKPFDGNGSIEAEIARHDALVGAAPLHASPAEHQATPDQRRSNGIGSYDGWLNAHEHGNFSGWRQYRKMLPGENIV